MDPYSDINQYKDKGMYKYYLGEGGDFSVKIPMERTAEAFEKLENPPPFLQFYAMAEKCGGTAKGRMWVSYMGNFAGAFGFPEKMIEKKLHVETFPIIASLAIRDVINEYAPGKYCSKFPNDVVCKEHGGKTSGILFKRCNGYITCGFGVNLIIAPPEELLRAQGLVACCLKKHTDNIPEPLELLERCANKTLELMKVHDNIADICQFINDGLGEFGPKVWRVEVNNPNADPDKDGALWCHDFPNALTKGYLNGKPYDVKNTYFDNTSCHRVADDEAAYAETIKKIEEDRKKYQKK